MKEFEINLESSIIFYILHVKKMDKIFAQIVMAQKVFSPTFLHICDITIYIFPQKCCSCSDAMI